MQFKDYYQTLGVSRSATQDEIKKAFRKAARKHHPDAVPEPEKAEAEARFKEMNEAYEVLGDPEKRQRYDTLGADWERGAQPPPGWQQGGGGFPGGARGMSAEDFEFNFGGTGFSDFFEAFFGGSRGGGDPFGQRGGGRARSARGADVEADIMVPLEEALHGAKRKITFQRRGGNLQTYHITIPAGVREGQRIRLGGQGEAAGPGGTAGDLYLNVRLAAHPDFRIEGSDLFYDFDAAPPLAVLGGTISIPTMEGKANLKLPAGSQPGQKFRLKGRGMPKGNGERGDLFVALNITIPKTLTAEQQEFWEKLSALS